MRNRPWWQRLLVITSVMVLLSVSAGLPSGAQEHSPLVTPSPTSTDTSVSPEPPHAQEKIAAALEAGTIDYPTSLLYRAYALFGDPRLPAEFAGAGSIFEDSGLADEVALAKAEIPAPILEALTPFLVRPTDPRSYFNQPPPNAKRVPSLQGAAATPANLECQGGWLGRRSVAPEKKLKVWAQCDGNEVGDVTFALAFAESLWFSMTLLMGPPIPDEGGPGAGGDDAIDIYLVKPGQQVGDAKISGAAMATTWSAEPFVGNTSSAVILMPRALIASNEFKVLVAHEFFHVLQNAHNYAIAHRADGIDAKGNTTWASYWFVEATATWAETYFVRPLSAVSHPKRFNRFQVDFAGTSLHAPTPELHRYAAYTWPLFMEQELTAHSIGVVWTSLEKVQRGDWTAADRAVDAQLHFSTRFRDFAVRNYNIKLPGDPIKPLYQALDPNVPPTPPKTLLLLLRALRYGEPPHTVEATIPSLSAIYHTYSPLTGTRQVTFRFEDLQPADALDVDVLYKIKNKPNWVRRKLGQGEKLRFCFNKKDEDLEDLVLVLSNHAMQIDTTVVGQYTVLPLDVPCGEYRIEGKYEVYWGGNGGVGPLIDSWSFEGEFSLSKDIPPGQPPDPNKPNGYGTFRGQQGRFRPGQKGCNPANSRSWSGQLAISAVVDGDKLALIVMPVVPVGTDSIPDVFSTRLDSDQYGGKKLKVPVEGGTYTWGGGVWGIEVDCGGLKPASGGSFTIVKIRDDENSSSSK